MTHNCPFASVRNGEAQNNNMPYRTIKIYPSLFKVNDDSSYYNSSIYDTLGTGDFPTTGNTAVGGVKIHSTNLEIWYSLDIPEGLSLEGIFLRISNTAGTSYITSQNLKVWKKNIGLKSKCICISRKNFMIRF